MNTSHQTHNHKTIQQWAEQYGGVPAKVKNTGKKNDGGVLRIHFPKHSDANSDFEQIGWDTFFQIFDENKLDMLYQDKKADGEESTFHKFVERG